MAIQTEDQAINSVLENIGTMVASEGGSLELLELDESSMKVKYIAGTNEECPECVPMTDAVWQFMKVALEVHAPRITTLEFDLLQYPFPVNRQTLQRPIHALRFAAVSHM